MGRGLLLTLLSVLGALALVVSACAPAATPTPTATPTPPPAVATPTPTPGPGAATPTPTVAIPTADFILRDGVRYWGPQFTPVYGETFKKVQASEPPHFDSHRATTGSVGQYTHPVFNSLIRWSPMRDMLRYEDWNELSWMEPDLAERWEASADGLVYTFYLRKGVKFHDGTPFTAKDVKYSFDKLLDPKRSGFFLDLEMLERTEVVDDYTVKMYLKFPTGMFLRYVGDNNFKHIQPEHLKAVNYRTPAFLVGTGAWKLKAYAPTVEISYVRNPDYHFKGRPYFDGFHVFFLDATAERSAFIGGRIDVTGVDSTDDVEAFRRLVPEGITVPQQTAIHSAIFYNFVKEGPWQDVRVRKAMTLAADLEGMDLVSKGGMTERAYYKAGYFFSAPLGPGLPWSEYEKAWWQNRSWEERIAEAKRLMAAAGYPNGFKASVLAADTMTYVLVFIDNMRKINIDLKADMVTRTIHVEQRFRLAWDMLADAWGTYTRSGEQGLSGEYVKGGKYNFGKYEHPVIEELFRQLQREPDEEKRSQLLHQAERILLEDIPSTVFTGTRSIKIVRPYYKPYYTSLPVDHGGPLQWRLEVAWFDKTDPSWAKRK